MKNDMNNYDQKILFSGLGMVLLLSGVSYTSICSPPFLTVPRPTSKLTTLREIRPDEFQEKNR